MQEEIRLVTEYLDKIGEKIGVGVEQIWPWLVRQQYIDALASTIIFIGFLAATGFLYRFWIKAEKEDKVGENFRTLFLIVFSILIGLGTFISGIDFLCDVPDIFNVEYHALKDLMQIAKP